MELVKETPYDGMTYKLLFPTVSSSYMDFCIEVGMTERTLKCKKSVFDSQLNPYFENTDIFSITTDMVEEYKRYLWGRNYSYRYEVHILSTLSCLFKWCVDNCIIPFNPFTSLITIKNNPQRTEFWNRTDFDKFISYFENDIMWKTFFSLMFLCSIQHYELRTVCMEDINLKDGTITVKKYLKRLNKNSSKREKITKYKEQKVYPITTECIELLREYLTDTKQCYDYPIFNVSYTSVFDMKKKSCMENHIKEIVFHKSKRSKKTYIV